MRKRNIEKTGSSIRSKTVAALLMSVIGVGLLSAAVLAQSTQQNSDPTTPSTSQHVIARGTAVSTTNSTTDVNLIRTVIVQVGNRTFGLLQFNGDVYNLRNVVFGNGTVTADIFNRELNQTVGSLNLQIQSVANELKNVVTGTITLNGTTYNVYAVETNVGHTFGHFGEEFHERIHEFIHGSQPPENEVAENES